MVHTSEQLKSATDALAKSKEQLSLIQREYAFYKELADKLESRQGDEMQELELRVRRLVESEKDSKLSAQMAEAERDESRQRERKLAAEVGKL